MAIRFFGETGPIRVPYRSARTREPDAEIVVEPRDHEPPLRGKQIPIDKRLPQHRATTMDRVHSQ